MFAQSCKQSGGAGHQRNAVIIKLLQRAFGHIFQHGDALFQGRFKIQLAAHGACGYIGDYVFFADGLGQFIKAFLFDNRAFQIGNQHFLLPRRIADTVNVNRLVAKAVSHGIGNAQHIGRNGILHRRVAEAVGLGQGRYGFGQPCQHVVVQRVAARLRSHYQKIRFCRFCHLQEPYMNELCLSFPSLLQAQRPAASPHWLWRWQKNIMAASSMPTACRFMTR